MFLLYTCFALIVLAAYDTSANECPKDWYPFNGNCYSFLGDYNKKYSWYAAQRLCNSKGAHLASIHTEEENQFIVTKGKYKGGQNWVGLNSLSGDLKWSDESIVNFTNIEEERQYYTKKCYSFTISTGKWNLVHCGRLLPAICKMPFTDYPTPVPPVTTPLPEGNCQSGWYQFDGACYKFFGSNEQDKKKWREARDACRSLGPNSDIVSIHSMEEQMFLTSLMYFHNDHTWIGLSVLEATGKQYEWTDNSEKNFEYWAQNYPESGSYLECGVINSESFAAGQWILELCDLYKYNYICKSTPELAIATPPPPPEPNTCEDSSDFNYRSSCYRYFSEPTPWNSAEDVCQQHGGHLVTVNDPFEQSFLYNILDVNKNVWIGLSTDEYKILHWTSNWPVYYSNFNKGQLNKKSEDKKSCIFMTDNALQWNTTRCDVTHSFLCEFTKETPPNFPKDIAGHCPDGRDDWTNVGDEYCYHIVPAVGNWGSGIFQCLTYSMEMISVHSEHVSKVLHSYIWKEGYNFWLGLIRTPDRDNFQWIDKSELDFLNWSEGEPSERSKSSKKDCVHISYKNGLWLPSECFQGGGVICRVPKVSY